MLFSSTVVLKVGSPALLCLKWKSPVLLCLKWKSPVLFCLKWKRPKSPHFLGTVLLKVEKYGTVALTVNQPLEVTSGHFWRQGSKMLKIRRPSVVRNLNLPFLFWPNLSNLHLANKPQNTHVKSSSRRSLQAVFGPLVARCALGTLP